MTWNMEIILIREHATSHLGKKQPEVRNRRDEGKQANMRKIKDIKCIINHVNDNIQVSGVNCSVMSFTKIQIIKVTHLNENEFSCEPSVCAWEIAQWRRQAGCWPLTRSALRTNFLLIS
jgi:hypothetical protein